MADDTSNNTSNDTSQYDQLVKKLIDTRVITLLPRKGNKDYSLIYNELFAPEADDQGDAGELALAQAQSQWAVFIRHCCNKAFYHNGMKTFDDACKPLAADLIDDKIKPLAKILSFAAEKQQKLPYLYAMCQGRTEGWARLLDVEMRGEPDLSADYTWLEPAERGWVNLMGVLWEQYRKYENYLRNIKAPGQIADTFEEWIVNALHGSRIKNTKVIISEEEKNIRAAITNFSNKAQHLRSRGYEPAAQEVDKIAKELTFETNQYFLADEPIRQQNVTTYVDRMRQIAQPQQRSLLGQHRDYFRVSHQLYRALLGLCGVFGQANSNWGMFFKERRDEATDSITRLNAVKFTVADTRPKPPPTPQAGG